MPLSQPEYGIIVAKDVMVAVRDGTRLATDIYRPAINGEPVPGQFPTILIRTSYDKAAGRYVDTIANFFTPRGYVTVQLTRDRVTANWHSVETIRTHTPALKSTHSMSAQRGRRAYDPA